MSSMAGHLLSRLVVIVCILLVTFNVVAEAAGRKSNSSRGKLEGQNQLKYLNKPPVKSIKSPDGDIIDCVHIAHQPSFNHPLLKDHKIQMRPSYHSKGASAANKVHKKGSKSIIQLWHLNGRCPKNTVPIRRFNKDDIVRESSVKTFGRKNHITIPQSSFTESLIPSTLGKNEYAIAYVEGDQFYGAQATINVWKPAVELLSEYSSAQIWLRGGPFEERSGIKAGWQVFPGLYKDNNPRFFIYFDNDLFKHMSCFNMHCSGFFQVSREIALGATVFNHSINGGAQYEITIKIEKDQIRGDWWLLLGYGHEEPQVVGYWVAELFPNMADGASMIEWGGEIVNSDSSARHTTTQMGSGRFPTEGFGNASYFWNIQILNAFREATSPQDIKTFTSRSNCYDIKLDKFNGREDLFLYGGPGRNSHCP